MKQKLILEKEPDHKDTCKKIQMHFYLNFLWLHHSEGSLLPVIAIKNGEAFVLAMEYPCTRFVFSQ